VLLGIDRLIRDRFRPFSGMRVGLLTNISCCDSTLNPTIAIFEKSHKIRLRAIFAPEHGLHAALQDQITVPDLQHQDNLEIHSLYGKHRRPARQALKDLDAVVIDLPDIGTRYYTFLWSAILMARECARMRKRLFILDRPDPLNGLTVQGPLLDKGFESFVGLYSVPVRHGMTIGELCNMLNREHGLDADITVIKMRGWKRAAFFSDTGLVWTAPSPNMPCFSTALIYPGMCLLEGTNVSEGRGTTKPFEIFGAPWIEPYSLARALGKCHIAGAVFRPTCFIPTFHKYRGQLCGGLQIHVIDPRRFSPVTAGLHIVRTIRKLHADHFRWRRPPYEFEKERMPFDILIGNSWIRKDLERNSTIGAIQKKWQPQLNKFKETRKQYLLYA
jgi:uncharacterized protein YbbC (DUF1343 family)